MKGYPPGIRENGGQYTHAALWTVIAYATLGDGDKAGELPAILNPITHTSTRAGVHRYRVEPYVVAADVYADPPHIGRGGVDVVHGVGGADASRGPGVDPGLPAARDPDPRRAVHPAGVAAVRDRVPLPLDAPHDRGGEPARRDARGSSVDVDGVRWEKTGPDIPLADDGAAHHVHVVLGR